MIREEEPRTRLVLRSEGSSRVDPDYHGFGGNGDSPVTNSINLIMVRIGVPEMGHEGLLKGGYEHG